MNECGNFRKNATYFSIWGDLLCARDNDFPSELPGGNGGATGDVESFTDQRYSRPVLKANRR